MKDDMEFREFCLDLKKLHVLASAIAKKACIANDAIAPLSLEFRKPLIAMITHQLQESFTLIHTHAESPIETIFFSSLLMTFAMQNPLYVTVTPPIDAESYPDKLREDYSGAIEAWEVYKEGVDSPDITLFAEALHARPNISKEEIETVMHYLVLYHVLGMHNKYHFSPQPRFGSVQINGSGIRPDLYIWVPSQPNFKLIVECDGFGYHFCKSAFSRDRARDRSLQIQGFQVFRFAGREIYHNTVGKSRELAEYLMSLRNDISN